MRVCTCRYECHLVGDRNSDFTFTMKMKSSESDEDGTNHLVLLSLGNKNKAQHERNVGAVASTFMGCTAAAAVQFLTDRQYGKYNLRIHFGVTFRLNS